MCSTPLKIEKKIEKGVLHTMSLKNHLANRIDWIRDRKCFPLLQHRGKNRKFRVLFQPSGSGL